MLKRMLAAGLAFLGLAILAAAAVLVSAHSQIRGVRPPLPEVAAVAGALERAVDAPVRVRWINTASQATPRSNVLGAGDPHPERPYRLCHSSFVLEWADGRLLLVDVGMTRGQAADFNATGELAGGEPGVVHTTVAETLGPQSRRVGGVVFSHLHVDHVDGSRDLCAARDGDAMAAFMTSAQLGPTNYTTVRDELDEIDCLRPTDIGGGLAALDGFPGVFVVAAGGHTPGSQIVVFSTGQGAEQRRFVITGDVVNHIDGVRYDVGKPLLYRMLVVPESDERLGEVRRYIRRLQDEIGAEVLVSHDQYALEASSVGEWTSADGEGKRR